MNSLSAITESFPILPQLKEYLLHEGHVDGLLIGWHCHLTDLTAVTAQVMMAAGARLYLSECNPDTTDDGAVEYMRSLGVVVHLGKGAPGLVLDARPTILSDTGLVLISAYLEKKGFPVFAGSEITTSGITKLRAMPPVPLPVVNINQGQLKRRIENFHGVGEGLIDAVSRLTSLSFAGRRAGTVVGYGQVGSGVCAYLKRLGAQVLVVEKDPILRLCAHYDGCALCTLAEALSSCELLVTASGQEKLLSGNEWDLAKDGLYVFNVGHWASEVDRGALNQMATSVTTISPHLEQFNLPGSSGRPDRRIFLAAGGSPVNVVLLSGSIEPTLIHLTTEMLCLNFLAGLKQSGQTLDNGETTIPLEVECQASLLALKGPEIERCLDPVQIPKV